MFDDELPGFGVRITAAGAKTYLLQYRLDGVRRRLTLGRHGDITPAQARQAATIARGLIASGRDPVIERADQLKVARDRHKPAGLTMRDLIDRWAAVALSERRPTYAREARRAVTSLLESRLDQLAAALLEEDAQGLVDAIGIERSIMARRSRDYARAMFNWASRRRLVRGNPFAAIEIEGREISRDRVLTDAELGRLWTAAAELGAVSGGFVRLLILTLQRRSEVAGMRWDEIDEERRTWTVPSARAKNGKAHAVHLTDEAWRVLQSVPRIGTPDGGLSGLVFTTTGTTPLSGLSKIRLQLERKILTPEDGPVAAASSATTWRFHDLRRTGVTRLAQQGVPPHVADKLLNHVEGVVRGTAAIYQRSDFLGERRSALEIWTRFVLACAGKASNSNAIKKPKLKRILAKSSGV